MKRKTRKRMLAAAGAAIMTLNMAACGDSGSQEPSDSGGQSENQESGSDEIEEVTIDIFMDSAGENPMTAGIQEDPVAQYIKEQTGVTLNVVLYSTEKAQAMAASGDLYDVNRMDAQYITPLIQAGAVQSLDEYLDYAPGLTENFPEMINYSREYMSAGEDQMYAVFARGKSEPSALATSRYGNFIRWEWYKEAGSPEINSIDDFLELLKTIQENHPETESGKKTYGISRFNDWGLNHTLSDPVIWKYIGQYGLNDLTAFSIPDLEYIDLYNEDHMYWITAQMYFKANQMGLLDPETYTQKNEQYTQKINEGQILFSSMEWDWDATNADLSQNGGTDKVVDIPWADTEEFPAWVSRASEFGMSARTFVVSSKCDETKMKGIMRLLDFVFSEDGARTIMNGPKGVTWDYDENGVAVFTDECKAEMEENPDYLLEQGANRYLGLVGQDYDAYAISEANQGEYIDLRLSRDYIQENMTEADKDYCEHYGVDIPLEVTTTRENQSTIYEGYINLMPAENPTSIQRSVTKIADYLQQAVPDMVFSETQEEYDQKFQDIQSELKDMGYDEVTEYFSDAWETAKTEYAKLTQE